MTRTADHAVTRVKCQENFVCEYVKPGNANWFPLNKFETVSLSVWFICIFGISFLKMITFYSIIKWFSKASSVMSTVVNMEDFWGWGLRLESENFKLCSWSCHIGWRFLNSSQKSFSKISFTPFFQIVIFAPINYSRPSR